MVTKKKSDLSIKKKNENKNIKMKKKILGAVQKLPGKQHGQFRPIWVKNGWIGCAI